MLNRASLLLTAVVSLAIGAGGAYAVLHMHITTECDRAAATALPPAVDHFFDAPAPRVGGGPRY